MAYDSKSRVLALASRTLRSLLNASDSKVVEVAEQYAPTTPADWGSTPPSTISGALDSLVSAGRVIASGLHTTTAATTNNISVTGVLATDIVLATINTVGGTPRTIVSAKGATNQVQVTFSGDPSTDHVVAYMVIRN